jgi:hypothetical protein
LKLLTEDIENSLLVIGIPKYQGETLWPINIHFFKNKGQEGKIGIFLDWF